MSNKKAQRNALETIKTIVDILAGIANIVLVAYTLLKG